MASEGGEDGGEIMVEVVGSDVFVDGVGGEGGGGDWNAEEGGVAVVREGLDREIESADGGDGAVGDLEPREVGDLGGGQACEDGTESQVEGCQEIAGLLVEQVHVNADEVPVRGEEGLEKSEQLIGGGDDAGDVLVADGTSGLDDEARDPGIRTGVADVLAAASGSSCQVTEVVGEEVAVTSSDQGLVEEGAEKGTTSVEGGGDALGLQQKDIRGDGLLNPGIDDPVVCYSMVSPSTSMQTTVVTEEAAAVVNDEFVNNKDEISCSGAKIGKENNVSSLAGTVSAVRDRDNTIHSDAECLKQKVEVAVSGEVGVMNKEEVLQQEGSIYCSVEGHPLKLEKLEMVEKNTESQGDFGADSVSHLEPTFVVADGEVTVVDEKISLNPNVEAPESVVIVGDGQEPLTTENRVIGVSDDHRDYVKDQELDVKDVGGGIGDPERNASLSDEPQFSNEKSKIVNINEVSVVDSEVASSKVETLTTDDLSGTPACSEDDPNMKFEKKQAIMPEHGRVLADPESSKDQDYVFHTEGVAAMDVEKALNHEADVAGNCSSTGKDQYLEVEKVDASCQKCVVHTGLEASGKQTQREVPKLEDVDLMKDENKVLNSNAAVLDCDSFSQKVEELNTLTVGETTGKEAIAQGSTEASGKQIETENQVEYSVLESKVTETVELKVETLGKSLVEDSSVVASSIPVGEHNSAIPTCLDDNTCLHDEQQETVAQLADLHSHEVDGDQSMNVIVDDTVVKGSCGEEHSNTAAAAACEVALNCLPTHNGGDPVSSSVSDSTGPLLDKHKKLEVHMVSREISVPSALNSNEVMTTEAKCEPYKSDEQVPQGQESMGGSLVVDLDICANKDGKVKPQDESLNENVSLPDECQFIRDDVQMLGGKVGIEFSECLDGSTATDFCLDNSHVGQEFEVQEQNSDAEQVDLYGGLEIEMGDQAPGHEQAKHLEDKSSKEMTLDPGSFAKVHQCNFLLPPENEGEFSVSDLVWGKVRSHPWWPGQVFDPSDASEKAMKYYRKDCFLVAYFGDRTFAWNEASLLKPFWANFSQIEKQSSSESFQNAVRCALEEVSRRIELGLACSCIQNDAYDKIESQVVENTGIRQESSKRCGVDKSVGVSSFEPEKLVEFVRALAGSPSAGADRLGVVIAKAQLLAFLRLKGYYELPEFQFCGGLLENNVDSSQLGEVIDHPPGDEQPFSIKGRPKTESSSSLKRKHNLKDSMYPKKKERSLSELMSDMPSSPDDCEDETSKSVASSSGRKRKVVDFISDDSEVQDRRISIYAAKVSTTASPIPKPSFKIGECIRRAASQLTGSPSSILKSSNEKFHKLGNSEEPTVFDDSLQTPDNSQRGRMTFFMEDSSLDEMLSQLLFAAQEPIREYGFLTTISPFFSGFRNSVSLIRQNSSVGKLGGGRKKRASHAIIGSPEEFEFDDINDSYWTDRIIQNCSEEQPSGDGHNREVKYQLVTFDPDKSLKSSRRSYSRKRFSNGNHQMAMEEPIRHIGERKQDNSPTELILNFSEGESIPSEINLNKIFKRFGPLREDETEVDLETSRARVVFKRCSDAEVALSSAEKFNIFGEMAVHYQLSYLPSVSIKTWPMETSHGLEDAT
ncbi:uncharacterized protein LOC127806974 isoform X2 [Diospyros lotus]|nr:uncharacterized protein LOC127806974 isoform X2 [Diospyros lotus]